MLKDKGILKAIWVGMYLLCLILSFLPAQEGANRVLLVLFAVLFFAAPGYLIWISLNNRDLATLRLIRLLSLVCLVGTTVAIVCNFLSILGPDWLGDVLYFLLLVLSVPMICGHYWVLSLTLWAALLWGSVLAIKKLRSK